MSSPPNGSGDAGGDNVSGTPTQPDALKPRPPAHTISAWTLHEAAPLCPAGHELLWTPVAQQQHTLAAGDAVQLLDTPLLRDVQEAHALWAPWMGELGSQQGTVVAVSMLAPHTPVKLAFDGREGLFAPQCIVRRLRPGDLVKVDGAVVNMKGGVRAECLSFATHGEVAVLIGQERRVVAEAAVREVRQRWRCGSNGCRAGHVRNGLWRWCCLDCSHSLCALCCHPPPHHLRTLFAAAHTTTTHLPPPDTVLRYLMNEDVASRPHIVTPPHSSRAVLGDWVILKPEFHETPKYGMGGVKPSEDVGVIVELESAVGACKVRFAVLEEGVLWRGSIAELFPLRISQRVSLKPGVEARYGRGSLKVSMDKPPVGTIQHIDPCGSVMIKWSSLPDLWNGHISELHFIVLAVGDYVCLHDETPAFGFGDATPQDIGIIKHIDGNIVYVTFAFSDSWACVASDLERVLPGCSVSTHPDIEVPCRGWQGTTKESCGVIRTFLPTAHPLGACLVDYPMKRGVVASVFELQPHLRFSYPDGKEVARGGDDPVGPPLVAAGRVSEERLVAQRIHLECATPELRQEKFLETRARLEAVYAEWGHGEADAMRAAYNSLYTHFFAEVAVVCLWGGVFFSPPN